MIRSTITRAVLRTRQATPAPLPPLDPPPVAPETPAPLLTVKRRARMKKTK